MFYMRFIKQQKRQVRGYCGVMIDTEDDKLHGSERTAFQFHILTSNYNMALDITFQIVGVDYLSFAHCIRDFPHIVRLSESVLNIKELLFANIIIPGRRSEMITPGSSRDRV